MLERLRGNLRTVGDHDAIVTVGPLDYEILVPSGDAARLRLAVGEPIEFVLLHYLESQSDKLDATLQQVALLGGQQAMQRAWLHENPQQQQ